MAVFVIASASVAGQATGIGALQTWIPYLTTTLMLLVAFAGRRRGRAAAGGPAAGAVIVCGAIVASAVFQIVPGSAESARATRVLPLLVGAALAEEIIFRDDLIEALMRAPRLRMLTDRRRQWTAGLLSQGAFTAVHLPTLILGSWRSDDAVAALGGGLAAAFTFGCLMMGMRRAGAGTIVRTIHHAAVNFVSIAVPFGLVEQVGRTLGATVVVMIAIAAAGWAARRHAFMLAPFRRSVAVQSPPEYVSRVRFSPRS